VHLYGAEADPAAIGESWLSSRCSLVIVTRGERGQLSFHARRVGLKLPCAVVLVDAVGAGDSFQAAMLTWLAEERHASPVELANLSSEELQAMVASLHAPRPPPATPRPEFPYRNALE